MLLLLAKKKRGKRVVSRGYLVPLRSPIVMLLFFINLFIRVFIGTAGTGVGVTFNTSKSNGLLTVVLGEFSSSIHLLNYSTFYFVSGNPAFFFTFFHPSKKS